MSLQSPATAAAACPACNVTHPHCWAPLDMRACHTAPLFAVEPRESVLGDGGRLQLDVHPLAPRFADEMFLVGVELAACAHPRHEGSPPAADWRRGGHAAEIVVQRAWRGDADADAREGWPVRALAPPQNAWRVDLVFEHVDYSARAPTHEHYRYATDAAVHVDCAAGTRWSPSWGRCVSGAAADHGPLLILLGYMAVAAAVALAVWRGSTPK